MQTALANYLTVTVTGGAYRITRPVIVPSDRRLTGSATLIQTTDTALLQIPDGSQNITIDGLAFAGDHSGGWTNGQHAAIDILGLHCQAISVTGCKFRNLTGFSVHNADGGARINVTGCTFDTCGNGLNVNGSDCDLSGNTFIDSEGIEAIGTNTRIENNTFTRALYVAISAGGDTGGGLHTGIVVQNNTINSVLTPEGSSTAIGINIADGCDGALIANNIIRGCVTGVNMACQGRGTKIKNTRITRNDIEASYNGLLLALDSDITGTDIDANKVRGAVLGVECYQAGVTIRNNDLLGAGSAYDIKIGAGAEATTLTNNTYTTIQDLRA